MQQGFETPRGRQIKNPRSQERGFFICALRGLQNPSGSTKLPGAILDDASRPQGEAHDVPSQTPRDELCKPSPQERGFFICAPRGLLNRSGSTKLPGAILDDARRPQGETHDVPSQTPRDQS